MNHVRLKLDHGDDADNDDDAVASAIIMICCSRNHMRS
jgi:hypothetical protein